MTMNIKVDWKLTLLIAAVFFGNMAGQFLYSSAYDTTVEDRIVDLQECIATLQRGMIALMTESVQKKTKQNPFMDIKIDKEEPNSIDDLWPAWSFEKEQK